jgi:glucokinase
MKKIIAIDLGGTNLRASLVVNNKIVKYMKNKTPKNEKELIDLLFKNIQLLMDKDVKGIGVSCAGPLKDGIIRNPPNLPLKNYNLKAALERRFKKRVKVFNDAHCVALAESLLGVKKKNFIILTLGTGVGGGIIINGKLYEGQGFGGEMGHMILDDGKDFESLVG